MIFFFSSRRRHTRWPRDWSSDVCSSDLEDRGAIAISKIDSRTGEIITDSEATFELYRVVNDEEVLMGEFTTEKGILELGNLRSEERRVGKECRSKRAG